MPKIFDIAFMQACGLEFSNLNRTVGESSESVFSSFELPRQFTPVFYTAPFSGFIAKASPLRMVDLDGFTDSSGLHKTMEFLSSTKIADFLRTNESVDLIQLVYKDNSGIPLAELVPKHLIFGDLKEFCITPPKARVGVQIPMSDYAWCGLNSFGAELILGATDISLSNSTTAVIKFEDFMRRKVERSPSPFEWSVVYERGHLEIYRDLTNCEFRKTQLVEIVRPSVWRSDMDELITWSKVIGEIEIHHFMNPAYLVHSATGNVYKVMPVDGSLNVLHIGYVAARPYSIQPGPREHHYYL